MNVSSNVSRIWRSVSRMSWRSSRSAVSRSSRWLSSSSTCATASAYSSFASGFTGPSCSRRFAEPLDPRAQRSACSGRAPRSPAPPPGRAAPRARPARARLGLGVAQLLRADLRRGQRVAALAQLVLDLRLLAGAGAQLGGDALPRLAVGGELGLDRLDAAGDRGAHPAERRGEGPGQRLQLLVGRPLGAQVLEAPAALGALARGAFGRAALGGQLALGLGAAHRGGALLRGLAPLLDSQPARRISSPAADRSRSARRAAWSASSRAASAAATAVLAPSARPARPARPGRRARNRR